MTGTVKIPMIASILLQYSLVILVYLFLFRILKLAYLDFTSPDQNKLLKKEPALARLMVISSGTVTLSAVQYEIDESIAIGRSEHNDIIVDDSFVSSEHACITAVKQDYVLTDLHSTNGTYVNNDRIAADVVLQPGDRIAIGPVSFKFER